MDITQSLMWPPDHFLDPRKQRADAISKKQNSWLFHEFSTHWLLGANTSSNTICEPEALTLSSS